MTESGMKAMKWRRRVRAFIHFQGKIISCRGLPLSAQNVEYCGGALPSAQQEGFKIPADFCVTS